MQCPSTDNGSLAIFGIAIAVAAYNIAKLWIDYLRDKDNLEED